jgi:molybdenum cofactor cytidylyltransferase
MTRVGVVVLAAGRSTRFAGPEPSKLLALVDGTPIVRRAVSAALDANVGEVVVVTGAQAREVENAISGMTVTVVYEPCFGDGMSHSLRRGIEALAAADAAMIALGDQPGVRPDAYRRVAARWRESGAPIVVPRYAGSSAPAHPALFAASIYPELLALDGDVGARSVIARSASRLVEERLEWPAPRDVDTVEDLQALTGRAAPTLGVEPRATSGSPSNPIEPR